MRDKFGAVQLSPRRDQPLLQRHGSQTLEALASPSISLTLCVVSGSDLRPMQKNITSNPMCEISLVLDDGSGPRSQQQSWSSGDSRTDIKRRNESGHSHNGQYSGGGVLAKTFKSRLLKSTLHPRWNLDVDFGDYNAESVLGVLIVVRHMEKMGLVKKDIGQVLIPMRTLLEMKMEPTREQTFVLEATDETNAREAQEGISNRKYGKVTLRFNSYGLTQKQPTPSSIENYTGLMAAGTPPPQTRPKSVSNGSVTHEDDFANNLRGNTPRHDVQAEVRKLQSFHQNKPVPGEVWYAIQSQWITNWLLFVSKHRGKAEYAPGEIDNMPLISDDLPNGVFIVRPNLVLKKDYRMINKRSWDFYVAQYGGGPAIEVPVPRDCPDTTKWLTSLRLEEAGRVGSGYFSSDDES